METNNHQSFVTGHNSGVVLGTSSEDIVEGLHQGEFSDHSSASGLPQDDDKIVNEQDQQEIVNPKEKEYVEGESEGGIASVTGIEEDEDVSADDNLTGEDGSSETGTSSTK